MSSIRQLGATPTVCVIDSERPDIISVGFMYALKYDVLLNRDGRRTFYYLSSHLPWGDILDNWVTAHRDAGVS
jgi:hypothetical protein